MYSAYTAQASDTATPASSWLLCLCLTERENNLWRPTSTTRFRAPRTKRSSTQGERHLKLSFHASAAMPIHNDTYLTCPTRVSALKAGKRHVLCGRNVLFLLLPLDDGRAAGVRGRRFTSKAGQRAAHMAASLEMWPRERRAFRQLFARSTRSAYDGCFARRRSLPYLVKSPQHITGSLATVLRERECRALGCTKATRP